MVVPVCLLEPDGQKHFVTLQFARAFSNLFSMMLLDTEPIVGDDPPLGTGAPFNNALEIDTDVPDDRVIPLTISLTPLLGGILQEFATTFPVDSDHLASSIVQRSTQHGNVKWRWSPVAAPREETDETEEEDQQQKEEDETTCMTMLSLCQEIYVLEHLDLTPKVTLALRLLMMDALDRELTYYCEYQSQIRAFFAGFVVHSPPDAIGAVRKLLPQTLCRTLDLFPLCYLRDIFVGRKTLKSGPVDMTTNALKQVLPRIPYFSKQFQGASRAQKDGVEPFTWLPSILFLGRRPATLRQAIVDLVEIFKCVSIQPERIEPMRSLIRECVTLTAQSLRTMLVLRLFFENANVIHHRCEIGTGTTAAANPLVGTQLWQETMALDNWNGQYCSLKEMPTASEVLFPVRLALGVALPLRIDQPRLLSLGMPDFDRRIDGLSSFDYRLDHHIGAHLELHLAALIESMDKFGPMPQPAPGKPMCMFCIPCSVHYLDERKVLDGTWNKLFARAPRASSLIFHALLAYMTANFRQFPHNHDWPIAGRTVNLFSYSNVRFCLVFYGSVWLYLEYVHRCMRNAQTAGLWDDTYIKRLCHNGAITPPPPPHPPATLEAAADGEKNNKKKKKVSLVGSKRFRRAEEQQPSATEPAAVSRGNP